MSLIGTCSDCGTGGVSLRYKPEVSVNEQSRPSICDRCRDFREEQATHYVPCEKCGDRLPSERAHSLDVTAEDEYYPEFIHFCPACAPDETDDEQDDEPELATDGGTEVGVLCDVDDCDSRIVGLDDGSEFSRGTVCQDCIDYQSRHGHWPDESVDICAECRIDDGLVPHECEESSADRVLIEPGTTCDYCGFEGAMTDGGKPAEDGQAVTQLKNQRWIEGKLRSLRFVEWDRFTVGDWNGEQSVSVYGWIDREDQYKDFVLVIFWPETEGHYFTTSSEERTEDIYRALVGEDVDEHNECRRVENAFNVSNAVRLDEEKLVTDGGESIKQECGECGELYNGYHECPHGEDRLAYTCSDCGEHVVRTTAGFEIKGVAPSRCLGCTFGVMAQ